MGFERGVIGLRGDAEVDLADEAEAAQGLAEQGLGAEVVYAEGEAVFLQTQRGEDVQVRWLSCGVMRPSA